MSGIWCVLAALTLVVGGCASPTTDDDAPREGSAGSSAAGDTHDGAAPVSVLTSWIRFMRAGQGKRACGLATPEFAQVLVGEAMSYGADPTRSCARAVDFLAARGHAPEPVTTYVVDTATDDETVLTLVRTGQPEQVVSVLLVEGEWLVNSIRYAPEPT